MSAALGVIGISTPTTAQQNEAVIAAFLRHMEMCGLSPVTMTNRRSGFGRLASFLTPIALLDATRDDLQRWSLSLLRYSPRTRYCKISIAHTFYEWAHLEGHIDRPPTVRLPRPKLPRNLPRPIPESRLEAALQDAPRDIRAWLILGSYAGLRCAEIAVLTRDCVLDASDPPVLIVSGKGNRERIVPMCNRVVTELGRYGMPISGSLWLPGRSRYGRPPSPNRISQLLNAWLHSQGVPDTAHSLRHRFATEVTRATGDIQTTATLLGHADLKNTMIYAQFSEERTYAAVLSLDAASSPTPDS